MAASEAMIVDAGGRDLRVSSPDRVIFPMTERSGAVTKLDIVRYYLAVGDGIEQQRKLLHEPSCAGATCGRIFGEAQLVNAVSIEGGA